MDQKLINLTKKLHANNPAINLSIRVHKQLCSDVHNYIQAEPIIHTQFKDCIIKNVNEVRILGPC